ncbi:MAG TPA: hypothetical protein VM884_00650 [Flavisolibacter sp.]|nr:hypothetical protein [Flavisolibacter sp.]
MKSNPFIVFIPLYLIAVCSFLSANGQEHLSHSKDGPETHNMLVVGEKTVFLSHLPMFQEKDSPPMPHRYQAILEVSFAKAGTNAQATYTKDRQSHTATKIYTISPEKFVLAQLVAADSLRHFKATVFRGHLEKPQTSPEKILLATDVTVKQVVHFREFDPAAKKPAQLEYLLFGKGGELFLAHLITTAPDFDQVVGVKITGRTFSDEELAKGVKLTFPGTTNTPSSRLKQGQQKDAEHKPNNALAAQKFRVQVTSEFYFEEGELRVPAAFSTTAEEKKAAFF